MKLKIWFTIKCVNKKFVKIQIMEVHGSWIMEVHNFVLSIFGHDSVLLLS